MRAFKLYEGYRDMRFTFLVLMLVLSACGGGNGKSSNPPPQQPPEKTVVEVVLNAVGEVLEEGDQFQLRAAAHDENGQTIVGKVISWRSLNTGVVTVNASGLVTAHAPGIASVEAKIDGVTAIWGASHFLPFYSVKHTRETIRPLK